MKRLLGFVLSVIMLTSLLIATPYPVEAEGDKNYNGLKVAYIPIDNRPVNYDRAIMLAKSVGIDLVTPEEDLFRTALDNMSPNKNGSTYGDREKLLEWLKETDKTCDYFVLSLDQLLSGGLVASRWLDNTDLSFEFEVADYIINLAKNNTIVLFDTVMRLASTVNYQGYQMNEYNNLRSYGSMARKVLKGNELTVKNIIAGYKYAPNGSKISTPLSENAVDKYLASRTRKLKLIDYILSQSLDDLEYCYIGVDDSSTTENIQTNEINYISNKLKNNGMIYAGTDELGLMGITRIVTKLYGKAEIGVTYFGGGENNIADGFDFATLKYELENHIKSLDCTVTAGGKGKLQVLCLTQGATNATAKQLVDKAEEYIKKQIPVIIIDPNTGTGSVLEKELLKRNFPLAMILGYSNWNTAANALGIALSNGISRYSYLANCSQITEESHYGFLQTIAFSGMKDISYKYFGFSIESPNASGNGSYTHILKMINNSNMITDLSTYRVNSHGKVKADNFRYPWDRAFEMVCDVSVEGFVTGVIGDISDDRTVRINDYLLAKRIIASNYSPNDGETARGDADGNSKIDENDCLIIKNQILNGK